MNDFLQADKAAQRPALFRDSASVERWLAAQPQANVPAMLENLQAQIAAFCQVAVTLRERFRTLEALRKAVFAVTAASQRRFENKPLPLAPVERDALDAVCRLWQTCAAAYQICLDACAKGDPSLSSRAARVAHRLLACLRREQLQCYAAGVEPGADFWKRLHAAFFAAERLGVAAELVEDRLLGETRESTVAGQYAMAVMLYLCRPQTLAGSHLAAAVRWLARWREQAAVLCTPDSAARDGMIVLDLAGAAPVCNPLNSPRLPRWLSLDRVQRKIRSRMAALDAGESPEDLKLGSSLPASTCRMLLEELAGHLQRPPFGLAGVSDNMPLLAVGTGLPRIHALMGGEGLHAELNPHVSVDDRLFKEQLAVFGHVVREDSAAEQQPLESWRLAFREGGKLVLLRAPADGGSRLALRSLLAIRQTDHFLLAVVTGILQRDDGLLCAEINLFPEGALPRSVEVRDRTTGRVARQPAFEVAANGGSVRLLLIPAGLMQRAAVARFFDAAGTPLSGLRLAECLERGGEVDFWRVSPA